MLREDLHAQLRRMKADTDVAIYEHLDRAVEEYVKKFTRHARRRHDDPRE
jgi:hypothetical protein